MKKKTITKFGYVFNPIGKQDFSVEAWSEIKAEIKKTKRKISPKITRYCPEAAIYKKEKQYYINQKLCKGCGICVKLNPKIFKLRPV